ncbi:MAG: hypothetical protein GY903_01030 [Fuerstiella sp.]|nr:hypothetical protein [Fuerstiella sp.]MCP4853061.1 hypothetical protein [Fuerstiella sp.]
MWVDLLYLGGGTTAAVAASWASLEATYHLTPASARRIALTTFAATAALFAWITL